MSSLYIKRLLDLGVRREEEVKEDDGWDEEGEEFIYSSNQIGNDAIEVRRRLMSAYLWDAALRPMLIASTIVVERQPQKYINTRKASPVLARHDRYPCQPCKAPLHSPQSCQNIYIRTPFNLPSSQH